MSKSTIIGIVVAVIVIGGGIGLWAANRNSDTTNDQTKTTDMNNMQNSTTNTDSTANNSSNTNPTAANAVDIKNFAFSPASITVKKGTSVTWTNSDSATHTVTESDGQTGPDSGDLANGKTYSFTFNTAGTFKYHCAIHPSMTGTVTVTE